MRKNKWLIALALIMFAVSLAGQDLPRTITNRHTLADWVRTGTFTFTNKTLDLAGSITLANDELIENSTDGDIDLVYDDDAVILGELFMKSSIDSPLVADNDLFNIKFRANDDSSTQTNWVTLEAKILDASDESEDSHFAIKTFAAGTEVTPLTMVGADGTFAGSVTFATAANPDASDGAALGTNALEWSDLFIADAGVINLGDDQDVTLTHVADTGVLINAAMEIQFRDNALTIGSTADGQLDIDADTEVEIATTTVDLNGILDVSGNTVMGGTLQVRNADGDTLRIDLGADSLTVVSLVVDDAQVFGLDSTGAIVSTGTIDQTITETVAGGDRGLNLAISQETNALTGTLTGVRGNARVNVESASGTVVGGEFLSGNMSAGYSLTTATGMYAGVTNKVPSGAVTWTNARGVEINMDLDQGTAGNTNTVTNAYMLYGVYNLPTAGSYATVTNGYGVFLRNEAVGGTGQMLDAALYIDDLSHTGGIKGWDFGIDLSGVGAASGAFGSADIRLANSEEINNTTDGTIAFTDGTNNLMTIVDGGTTGNVTVTGTFEVENSITMANGINAGNATFDNGVALDTLALTGVAAGDVAIATFTSDPGSPGAHWTWCVTDTVFIGTDAAVSGTPTWSAVVFKKN